MTTTTATAEVQGLLRLALEHSRRTWRTHWVSTTLRGTKISIRVIRSFDKRVQVWLALSRGPHRSPGEVDLQGFGTQGGN